MKWITLFLIFLSSCHCYAGMLIVHRLNILVTDKGIFYEHLGSIVSSQTMSYIGDGYFAVEYYGCCKECGWGLGQQNQCDNPCCERYPMRE